MTTLHHRNSKSILSMLLAMIMAISLIAAFAGVEVSAVSDNFYVSGTTIYDANGNQFIMRGVNIPHAWYPGETETSIRAAASLGSNTVRIVLSDGTVYSKTTRQELENIINWCKTYNVVGVFDVHDTTGSDSYDALNSAVNYWIEMKDLLVANQKYVIVNIANEWYGTWDGAAWANGYKSAIQNLRNAGITNMLMVDCAGWGQYPDSIRYYGGEVFNADPQRNLVFSIHMYEYAGGQAETSRANIDNALSIGVPLVIGEFGHYHTNGDVDEYAIMSYCRERGVGYIAWSWCGNGTGYEYLNIATNWDGSGLTDWGNTLFYDTNGIKNTSSVCSVYTSSATLNGEYYIKNVHSGKYLDVDGNSGDNGANIHQWSFNGSNAQRFKLVSDGNGYYSILTAASGYTKSLDVAGWSADNGANIHQWDYHGGDCQKFQLIQIGNAWAIKTKVSSCYSALDVDGWSTNDGANVAQWSYHGGNCQLWILERA